MFRGTTARTVFALLAAALLAVQFFAPTATFAAAHTLRHAEAKAASGPQTHAAILRDDHHVLRGHGRCGELPGPPRVADRQRTSTAGWADDRPPAARHTEAIPARTALAVPRDHAPRTSTTHSPAALQVFRC
ncbi:MULTISPECIES: hypothetical protein [unclassified Streptomyces]|uniref:hypothetical protein n=1 Tax=unclassified Streptomyces TaxID=2593676 RepID=UPI0033292346